MKTQFLSFETKRKLFDKLSKGDIEQEKAMDIALREIERLENIIKNLEMGIEQVTHQYNSDFCKTPVNWESYIDNGDKEA